jgi:hypothetical protein
MTIRNRGSAWVIVLKKLRERYLEDVSAQFKALERPAIAAMPSGTRLRRLTFDDVREAIPASRVTA